MTIPNAIPPLARFEAHPLRLLIQERLQKVPAGELVTYEELDALVGFDVRTEAPHLLQSARDQLIDEGVVFDTVINVGVKRASNGTTVSIVEGQAKRSLSAAQKGARIIKLVDYEALSPTERIRFGVAQIRIGIVQQFSRRAVGRKLAAAIEAGTEPKKLSDGVVSSLKQFDKVRRPA